MYEMVKQEIANLKALAVKYGCQIRFRNSPTYAGDFCIYIYDKSFRKSYAVGYDGYYDSQYPTLSFKNCVEQAKNWLIHRDKRFKRVNGAWVINEEYFKK